MGETEGDCTVYSSVPEELESWSSCGEYSLDDDGILTAGQDLRLPPRLQKVDSVLLLVVDGCCVPTVALAAEGLTVLLLVAVDRSWRRTVAMAADGRWCLTVVKAVDGREVSDYWFEVLNICINVALWYMKRAAWVSGKDEVLEHDAKHIHTSLRRAAGLFQFVLQNKDKLIGMYEFQGCDLESNILDAYVNQCVAEAQEVTIARAIELKHSPKIISSLAAETAHKYELCEKLIEKYNPANFEKWRSYFQLKKNFYFAYAYAYLGESLLSEDKCGEAVRACKQGITSYEKAEEICGKYAKASGPGFVAKPEKHLFFRRIQPLLNRHLEKAERENGMIYHHTVPADAPLLESKAAYGLANPEPYEFPKPADEWSTFVYNAFDISKAFVPDFGKPKKSAKPLPPVKEEKVYETDKDPTNNSGCVIS